MRAVEQPQPGEPQRAEVAAQDRKPAKSEGMQDVSRAGKQEAGRRTKPLQGVAEDADRQGSSPCSQRR